MNVIERVETDFHKKYYLVKWNKLTYLLLSSYSNNIDLMVLIGAK